MSNYAKLAAETGDRYLRLLASRQQRVLAYAAAARALAQGAGTSPAAALAVATSRHFNAAYFALAARMLAQQKRFLDQLFASQATQAKHSGSSAAALQPAKRRSATTARARRRKT